MVATTVRLHNAGETRPVAVKHTAREESEAHPEHVEGDGRAGGTMERRVDSHSDHGGASNEDSDVLVAAVSEMIN